jgi:hypothetical protein
MADPGSVEIKSLLDTPSDSLAALMNTLQEAMAQTQHDDNLTVPPSTFSAIRALSSYYRDLGNKVTSISTSSPAKKDVLAALTELEASLVKLSRALREGTTANATPDLDAAAQATGRAGNLLAHASDRLAH